MASSKELVHGSMSKLKPVISGVSQRSILRPIVFIILINDTGTLSKFALTPNGVVQLTLYWGRDAIQRYLDRFER